jgi:hypothetical protein
VEEPDLELLAEVVPRVSPELNEALMQHLTAEDMKRALFLIGDMKSLGADHVSASLGCITQGPIRGASSQRYK